MDRSFDIINFVKLLKSRLKVLNERESDNESRLVLEEKSDLRIKIEALEARRNELRPLLGNSDEDDSASLLNAKLIKVGHRVCDEIEEIRNNIAESHPEGDTLLLQSKFEKLQIEVLSLESRLEGKNSRSLLDEQAEPVKTDPQASIKKEVYLTPGTLLADRYKVARVIGKGGTSAIYGVTDLRTPQVWAMKELWSNNPTFKPEQISHQLEAEVRILSNLRHPNLPRIVDSFAEGSRHYIVMDFVEGQTLKSILNENPRLPLILAYDLGLKLARVLHYLHTQNPPIVFRDLKPPNIMIGEAGALKLIDFGIARHFSEQASKDTQALGTPGYAAPEQYGNSCSQSDIRADVYALGANLHEMLTGEDPSRTPFVFRPVRSSRPEVSAAVEELVARCVQLDVDMRYQDLSDVIYTLENELRLLGADSKKASHETSDLQKDIQSVEPEPAAQESIAQEVGESHIRPQGSENSEEPKPRSVGLVTGLLLLMFFCWLAWSLVVS